MTTHKFAVGQTIHFTADRQQLAPAQSRFKILQLLPEAGSGFQYRVKSQVDGQERVVREDQLLRA